MGIGKNLNNELGQWAVLAILLVVLMIILGKVKTVAMQLAPDNGTGSVNATMQSVSDNFVTGLSEPGNWIVIVVVGLVGFALIRFMQNRKK